MPVLHPRYLVGKRAFDLAICLLLLPLALVLSLASAIAILMDSRGPIFIAQERTGRDGNRFRMYKFRTMVPNAEELKPFLAHLSIVPAPDFKIIDDPRITRVGRILRKTSLDEIPQLINVLRGEMSLVGPRPGLREREERADRSVRRDFCGCLKLASHRREERRVRFPFSVCRRV